MIGEAAVLGELGDIADVYRLEPGLAGSEVEAKTDRLRHDRSY